VGFSLRRLCVGGGGFLLTPFLIFIGNPPAVAVASSANQLRGRLGLRRHRPLAARQRRFPHGLRAAGGRLLGLRPGASGSSPSCAAIGQVELVVTISYVVLLGVLGLLMLIESTAG